MTSTNIAIVFAPNLLRARVESYQQVAAHSSAVNAVNKAMIEHYSEIFQRELDTGPMSPPLSPLAREDSDEEEERMPVQRPRVPLRELSQGPNRRRVQSDVQVTMNTTQVSKPLMDSTTKMLSALEEKATTLWTRDPYSAAELFEKVVNIFRNIAGEEDEEVLNSARAESGVSLYDQVKGFLTQMKLGLNESPTLKGVVEINRIALLIDKALSRDDS
eukprot:TRINITY_DN15204_c0_g1_i2.p1 TRINITY_DN15204_c0_g1~~TRINITY_DN15204_c0_g1_i2.p1  ORF type:complete len:217 (-),score=51.23 TRINITY_DN15204_c0_g1_i2:195-845(-)